MDNETTGFNRFNVITMMPNIRKTLEVIKAL
jgi:hypothetical protein